MRPVLAILITLSLMGGVFGYVRFAESVRRPAVDIQIDYAVGEYSVTVERTFACVGDPILETESLRVLFKGEKVFATSEPIPADKTIEVRPLDGIETGENEIYVSASRESSTGGFGALKITVFRNDIPIVEKIITSDEGLTDVGGPVVFTVDATNEQDDHGH